MEYDLHILRLFDAAFWVGDGERNEMVPAVTLPLNVSLDVGSYRGTQRDLATIDMDSWGHVLGQVTRPR